MERSGHLVPNSAEPLFFTHEGKAFAPVTYLELHVGASPREGGPDFAKKYGPRVLRANGTFTHARGHDNHRYVELPTTGEGLQLADEILKVYGDDPCTTRKRNSIFATVVILRTGGTRGKWEYTGQDQAQFSASWFVSRTTADAVAAHNATLSAKPGVLSRAAVEALVAGFCEALLASPPLSLEQFARDKAEYAVNRALAWTAEPSCFTDGVPRGLSLEDEVTVLRTALAAREKALYESSCARGWSKA